MRAGADHIVSGIEVCHAKHRRVRTQLVLLWCLFASLALLSHACTGGINPEDYAQKNTISGRISFVQGAGAQHFPVADSLRDLRVVAFHDIPKDSGLVTQLLSGTAIYTTSTLLDSTFHYQSSIGYSLLVPDNQFTNGVAHFGYIVVAQQYGSNVLTDWQAVGVYSSDSLFSPLGIDLQKGQSNTNVNISVDFLHLPPQPFKH